MLGETGYFHSLALNSPSVITYHGVLPEGYQSSDPFLDNTLLSIETFRQHLRLLKKHYHPITPEGFRGWLRGSEKLPNRSVLLTCDDGLQNNLTTMLPLLQQEGLQCLFFVTGQSLSELPGMLWYVELYLMMIEARDEHPQMDWRGSAVPALPSGLEGKRAVWLDLMNMLSRFDATGRTDFLRHAEEAWEVDPAWKQRYPEDRLLQQRFQLLCADELKQLADAGMTLGAHTMSHPVLRQQPDDCARAEISDSRLRLAKALGRPVWALAYPFGGLTAAGDREFHIAESAGYECAFMNIGGPVGAASAKFALPRVQVNADMSLPVYEAHVSGFHDSLRRRLRRSGSTF